MDSLLVVRWEAVMGLGLEGCSGVLTMLALNLEWVLDHTREEWKGNWWDALMGVEWDWCLVVDWVSHWETGLEVLLAFGWGHGLVLLMVVLMGALWG